MTVACAGADRVRPAWSRHSIELRQSSDVGGELFGQQSDEIPHLVQPPAADVADRAGANVQFFERQRSVCERTDARSADAHANGGREVIAAAPKIARSRIAFGLGRVRSDRRHASGVDGDDRSRRESVRSDCRGGAGLIEVEMTRTGDELCVARTESCLPALANQRGPRDHLGDGTGRRERLEGHAPRASSYR